MAETRQQLLVKMSRQLEEMRAHQAQELRFQAMQESISRMMEMMQTLVTQQRPVTDPSSSTNGNPTLPQHPPRPPDPVVAGTGGSTATEQPLAHRAPLNPHGLTTRLARFEFPKFDGALLREWIYRCEQFFMLDSTPPESKVRLASLHMEGKVLQWHHTYMSTRYDQFPLWPEYIVAMTTHFGGELFDGPLAEPVSSKQNAESVEDEVQTEEQYSTEACDANLHKGGLKCDELIHRDVEPSQILVENESNSAKESSVFVAHQVLEEMPRPFFSDELVFLDEVEKINDELLDGMNSKVPPFGSVDELDGAKVTEDGKLRNTIPTTHALKLPTEFSEQESMTNGVVCVICFDPGGNNLSHRDHATCLSNKNFEISAGEDNKSVDEVFSQLKESYQAAAQGTHTSYAEHVLEVAAAQGKIGLGCTEILCFDPGGGSLPVVDNSLRLELGGGDLLVVNDSLKFKLSLQEKCGLWCIDELLCEMTNALQISLFGDHVHNPFNLECDQGKENARWPNLVLDPSPFDSIVCLEIFCFDPGGEETLCTFDSLDWYCADMKLRDVAAELLGLKKRIAKVLYVQFELLDVPDDQLLVFVDNNEVVQYMGFVPYLLEFLLCDYAAGLATFYYGYPSYSPPRGLESCYTHEYIHISQSCDIGVPLSKDLDPTVFACLKQFLTENKLKKIALRVGDVSLSKEAELRASVFEAIEKEDQVVEKEEGLHPALLGSCNDRAKQLHWHECSVKKVDREELLKQKGCVIWITGLSGSGKSTVACALSRILHSMGRMTYVLDGDNLQHGLNSNLNFDAEDWTENIRRTGEVAKLFANAAAHDHHEGNVLILVFDPGGEHVQLMSLVAMLAFQSYILEDKDLLNKGELLQEYQY